jgi:hypothetical protein
MRLTGLVPIGSGRGSAQGSGAVGNLKWRGLLRHFILLLRGHLTCAARLILNYNLVKFGPANYYVDLYPEVSVNVAKLGRHCKLSIR